jgi:hypothetical protein
MTREGDQQPPETLIRRSVRYVRIPSVMDPNAPEAVAARLLRAAAESMITEGSCPVHPYRRLTRQTLGLSARGGGTCEDCSGFWSYSPRTGVVFIGPSAALPGYLPSPSLSAPPMHTLGVCGFEPYLAAETISQLIDIAEMLDNTPFAEEDVLEAGKKILRTAKVGQKVLVIAVAMALGHKLGYSR